MAMSDAIAGDFLLIDDPAPGLQRLRGQFGGHAYEPHRHETYAIGLTEWGVQGFRYRGVEQASTMGRIIVLHPDETHDGHAVVASGFAYRMIYVDAGLIGAALPGGSLPFVPEAVGRDPQLAAVLRDAFDDFPGRLGSIEAASLVAALADGLHRRSDAPRSEVRAIWQGRALEGARELLDADSDQEVSADRLEAETGLDRYTLARGFRARFGTSPHRYHIGRRLHAVRAAIAAGMPLAQAAAAHGFADQSHLTRHFKARYGMTPGRYVRLLRAVPDAAA